MKNINVGITNLFISKILTETFFKERFVTETEFDKNVVSESIKSLINTIKKSPILQLEFKVFNNLENKKINDSNLASRYIDNNIKLFEVYTHDELINEHKKLEPFINLDTMNINNDNKSKLYESIGNLIEESVKSNEEIDVDRIHESFSFVLEYIKKPKENKENNSLNEINENVIELAIDKFNNKYKKMRLDEVNLFKKLISSDNEEKQNLFEELKENNINLLNSLIKEESNDKITKSLEKINNMNYISEQADSDIIKLFELKQGLEND